jgi:hypothetical protein
VHTCGTYIVIAQQLFPNSQALQLVEGTPGVLVFAGLRNKLMRHETKGTKSAHTGRFIRDRKGCS